MEPEVIVYTIKEMKEDIKEVKTDVKALMMFMAIEKANQKRNVMFISGFMSIIVSLITFGLTKYLGG